jgi:hypothetical protein
MLFATAFRKSIFAAADWKEVLSSPLKVFEAENEIAVYKFFGYTFVGLPVGWEVLRVVGIDVDGSAEGEMVGLFVGEVVGIWVMR